MQQCTASSFCITASAPIISLHRRIRIIWLHFVCCVLLFCRCFLLLITRHHYNIRIMRCNRIRPPHRKKKDINNFKGDLRRYLLIRTLVDKRNMHRMSVNLFFHVLQNALKRPLNDFETVKALVHHTLIHQNFTSSFCINESFHSKQDVWYKDSSKYFVSYESHENETRIIFWRPWPSRTESVQVIHENLKQRNHNREYSLVEAIRQKLFTFDEDSSNFLNDNDASANTC